ncbi:MAG: cytochrome c biogenesis CcdA family protein [Fervidobacterium sp.]|jgi:cytochrome c-type biogenesis protein
MVTIGIVDVSIWMAIVSGLLSFFSPCVLPLIPGFIGIVLGGKKKVQKLMGFFLGFSAMFTLLGAFSSAIGGFLTRFGGVVEKLIGISIIIFGIIYTSEIQLFRGKSVNIWKYKNVGFFGGLLLGLAVGFVWIPCSSPVLASMMMIASQKSLVKGMVLLFVYSLGISVPFLTIGTVLSRILTKGFGTPSWERWTKYMGGAFIILMGLLIFFGKMKV